MNENDNKQKIFVLVSDLVKETGLPYKKILIDIRKGKLPAKKIGKSYYIYREDSSRYIFNMICEARGVNPDDYLPFIGMDQASIYQAMIKGGDINDKPKN